MSRKGSRRSGKRRRQSQRPDEPVRVRRAGSDWLPPWAPYAVFALLAAFLFREFIVSNGLIFGTDVIALGYFARHFYAEMIRAGTFPYWNPFVFGGLPFVDGMHGDIFYPTTVLKFIMPVHRAMGWKLVLHVFLAAVFTYHWLRYLRIDRPIAMFGSVTYMLAPVLISLVYPGHDGKLFVSALTPLALWVTDWAVTLGGARRFATLALVVALLIFTAHMQLGYYTTWAVSALAVFRLVQAKRSGRSATWVARRLAAFALAGIIGALAIGAVQLWTPLRYLTKYSQRVEKSIEAEAEDAYSRATSYSLHPEEAFSLIVPEFIGANIDAGAGRVDTYWGRNLFKLNHEYGGLVPLLLLPFAFILRRRRGEVWLFTGIAIASLVYALGATTPLFHLFYWLVPGVKLFRAPSSIMYVFAIAVITAAAIGLSGADESEGTAEWRDVSRGASRYLWTATGVLALLAILGSTGVFTEIWTSTIYRNIDADKLAALQSNLTNIKRGLWLSVLIAALVAAGWELRRRGSLPRAAWIVALATLSALDLLRVSPGFIRVVNPTAYFPRDDVTEYLLQRRGEYGPFRVFPIAGAPYQPNHFAFYGLEEVAGHHGNEMGRYSELVNFQRPGVDLLRTLRLLNVRYIVSPAPLQAPDLDEAYRGQRAVVYMLRGTFERARLVGRTEVVSDSLALQRLAQPDFTPRFTALLPEDGDQLELAGTVRGNVRWGEWGVNSQRLEVETEGPALLVITDNYYPAWRASLDGEPTRVYRADYTFRAVRLPAGRHEVRLHYHSPLFLAATWTSLLSTSGALGLIGFSLFVERKRSPGSPDSV